MVVVNEGMFPIFPVYTQATEPTDKTKGKFWYNTSNGSVYVSDGTNYNSLDTSSKDIIDAISRNRLNILINSIASSSNLYDYEDGVVDIFADADGTDDTVDTGNTTASFFNDRYINETFEQINVDVAYGSGDSRTGKSGIKITTGGVGFDVVSLIRDSAVASTVGYILDAGKSIIATANFVGDKATFSSPFTLSPSTDYYFCSDSSGGSYASRNNAASFPIAKTPFNWVGGLDNGNDNAGGIYNIEGAETKRTPLDKVVQTNTFVIPAGSTAIQMFCENTVAGNGSVTYDLKIESDAWVLGNALDSKIAISNTGNALLRFNLNGVGAGNTAEIENYCGFLFSS